MASRNAPTPSTDYIGWWNTLKPEQKAARIEESVEAALLEGTHSLDRLRLCNGCNEWVDLIWFITAEGKSLCKKCAPPPLQRLTPKQLQSLRGD